MSPAPHLDHNHALENGWQAHLQLTLQTVHCATGHARTVLGRCRHLGPLRIQRPFYPEGDLAHVYILHPPGGVVGGDQLRIDVDVKPKAQALCTTPGCGKFYLSAAPLALFDQHLRVRSGASLEWLPQENILFAGARLQARTCITVEDNGIFIGWDINCLGRPGSHERFEQGTFHSRLMFYHNEKLILVENQRVFSPQMLDSAAGLRGNPMQATLLAFPCEQHHLEHARSQLTMTTPDAAKLSALTLVDGVLVMRVLGNNGEKLKRQLFNVWKTLRPLLLERDALAPRIWAT
ncbi:Urease accessory protein UreD [hydrothermal vent metagenome]|uniref:Urease accessory protein UreD n=1 Tax=hydrothermal vent metagenome TaxID=652676 RepID=A0A3B0X3P7_9ZZZZ